MRLQLRKPGKSQLAEPRRRSGTQSPADPGKVIGKGRRLDAVVLRRGDAAKELAAGIVPPDRLPGLEAPYESRPRFALQASDLAVGREGGEEHCVRHCQASAAGRARKIPNEL